MWFSKIEQNHIDLLTRAWKTFVTESIFWQTKVRCVRHKPISVKWVSNCWQLQLSTFLQVQTCKTTFSAMSKRLCVAFLAAEPFTDRSGNKKSISQSSEHSLGILSLINLLIPFLNSLILLISVRLQSKQLQCNWIHCLRFAWHIFVSLTMLPQHKLHM